MRLLILGAAVSGTAAARLGRQLGHEVQVYDQSREAIEGLQDEGFTVHFGSWAPYLLDDVDAVVTSPGIPEHAAPIVDSLAAGLPLCSELEFASRSLDADCVAVTGTNGKTTVVSATTAMLANSGLTVTAAGNVGTALSSVVDRPWDVVVVEASSFQLSFIDRFHPRAAAVLNVVPDHLDWHGTFDRYREAKARIFDNMDGGDVLVYDADDPVATALVARSAARLVPISGSRQPREGNGPSGEHLIIGDRDFPLPPGDRAILSDLTAAATLAFTMGAVADAVALVLAAFSPGPHRRSLVGTWRGVTWIDDSKATNPHAASTSARAYPSVILIAGGRNKGLDLTPLTQPETVRHIVALGESADDIAALAANRVTTVDDMVAAVAVAADLAVSGDTVLLAPGCASFDQFESYAARGEAFSSAVLARNGASA